MNKDPHAPQMKVGPDRKYLGQTYSEWIGSLAPRDPVRIRHPWQDLTAPGGRIDKGYVVEKLDENHSGRSVVVCFHNTIKGETETIAFNAEGCMGYRHLEHPDILSAMQPDGRADQSVEFLTGIELLAIESRRENNRALASLTPPVEPHSVPSDFATPDWKAAHQKFDWRNYISEPLRGIWDSFTLLQKAVIAASAEESASGEDWEQRESD